MYCPTYRDAVRQARANALTFGVPYIVFQSTGLRWYCERDTGSFLGNVAVRILPPDGNCLTAREG